MSEDTSQTDDLLDALTSGLEDVTRRESESGATEVVAGIGADLAALVREQELNRTSLQNISNQLSVLRQVVDYVLFVTPDQAQAEDDLYPVSTWFQTQFSKLSATPQAEGGEPESAHEVLLAVERAINTEVDHLQEALRNSLDTVELRVRQALQEYAEALSEQQGKLELVLEKLNKLEESRELSPYDDFDLQVQELKKYIKDRTSHWRVYENFFYGLVILMLFANLGVLLWMTMTN